MENFGEKGSLSEKENSKEKEDLKEKENSKEKENLRVNLKRILEEALKSAENSEWIFLIQDKVAEKELQKLNENLKKIKGEIFWIGIGGSSSGPRAIFKLSEIDVKFFESPEDKFDLQEKIKKSKNYTLYIVSKSGETFETISLMKTAEKLIKTQNQKKKRNFDILVITTHNENTPLYKFAQKNQARIIHFPEKLSGRFSTFFISYPPLTLTKEDILKKVKRGIEKVRKNIFDENSLHFKLTEFLLENIEKRKNQDLFLCFYSRKLFELGEITSQLIGESLGKDGKGITPIPILGPHFQHSIAQLILANPNQKCAIFILPKNKEKYKENLKEAEATFKVFSAKIPVMKIEIEETPEDISYFLFSFKISIALSGKIMGINPFDQPEVKKIRDILLGKN